MPKKKASKKRGSSFKSMPTKDLRKSLKAIPFKAASRIKNKDYVSRALWECIVADDPDGFKEILRAHLELTNKEKFAKQTGISRRTLFRILSEEGNPTLDNISKIVSKLCA